MIRVQMITLFVALSSSVWASTAERHCMSEIIDSPETKRYFPTLHHQAQSSNFDQRTVEFLEEVKNFCTCHTNAPTAENIFPDKQALLAHEDACAGKNLAGDAFEVHYEIALARLSHEIVQRLETRYTKGIRNLASVGSYNQKMSCLHQSILSRCSRSKSLQMSYQCILEITTSRHFNRYEANCPEFREGSSPIPEHNDLMI